MTRRRIPIVAVGAVCLLGAWARPADDAEAGGPAYAAAADTGQASVAVRVRGEEGGKGAG